MQRSEGTSDGPFADAGAPRPDGSRDLAAEVDELRKDVAALQLSMKAEIRTRRVVVEEPDGFPRVVLEARGMFGGVEVRSRAHAGEDSTAGLFALDPGDGDPAQVGMCISDRGDIVASFDVYSRHLPRLWTGGSSQADG